MKLMMVCPTCNMRGEVIKETITRSFYYEKCPDCHGKAVVDPPQQILDDLDCAEIEREINKCFRLSIDYSKAYVEIWVYDKETPLYVYTTEGKTKLEALRKAKAWLDGRGE